ncbi:uncharacterized protein [Aristolochia californica]|uniref:uncharacterized protein n=1 Tax=Aristolochia californica TaxID=171875 RepID=UPI0035E075FB
MDDGNEGYGDRGEHFHRNEAISAVADDGFLGEEDDDYEDLYNDVNVGEGFLQSLRRNEDVDDKNDVKEEEKRIEPPTFNTISVSATAPVSIPGVGAGDGGGDKEPVPQGVSKGFPESGYRGNEVVPRAPPNGPGGVGGGKRVELGQASVKSEIGGQIGNNSLQPPPQPQHPPQPVVNENFSRQGPGPGSGVGVGVGVGVGGSTNVNGGSGHGGGIGSNGQAGTILFVGELHWWTTDAELESELSKYGQVKEVKFFDEKASGKSKGYCQVEFYDPAAASVCKDGMNGYVFNGRPCVVAFASPYTVRRMGEAQVKNQSVSQGSLQQGRRPGDVSGTGRGNAISTGANYQGGDAGRNFGRGGWGRGGSMGGRGQMGPMRNRMGMGGRGIMGNGGTGFGQGLATATPPLLHPQTMMGQGFDPSYGAAAMGRMGGYGGFPAGPTPPFSGIMPTFPPVGGMGLPGVAPHVNPAFFGRGMPGSGMGMMPGAGVDGSGVGMWSDPSMAGWVGEEQGGKAGDSSYGEDATSDQQYGEDSHERGWSNPSKEKDRDRAPDRDFSGAGSDRRYRDEREGWDRAEKDVGPEQDWSERRHRDDKEMGWERDRECERDRERDRERERDRSREHDRDRYRDDRERYSDHHKYRDREVDHNDEWDRGRSSRTRSKSRMSHEDEQRHRSRELEHGKRRRLPSE